MPAMPIDTFITCLPPHACAEPDAARALLKDITTDAITRASRQLSCRHIVHDEIATPVYDVITLAR